MEQYIKSITQFLLQVSDYNDAYRIYNNWVIHTGNIIKSPEISQYLISFINQFKTSDRLLIQNAINIY